MRLARRRFLLGCAGTLFGTRAFADSTHAVIPAAFPSRPVRIVVPYSVGLGPDIVARTLAAYLSDRWGQPVLADNRPGASGIVAFNEVRNVPADGHTLFIGDAGTLVVNPLIHHDLPYDPVRDLVPLTLLFRATFFILTGGMGRFASMQELLAAARAQPGMVSYASLGNGHPSQVAIESFAAEARLTLLHVPFKDAGTAFTAVANNDVDFMAFSWNSVAGLLRSGKLRPWRWRRMRVRARRPTSRRSPKPGRRPSRCVPGPRWLRPRRRRSRRASASTATCMLRWGTTPCASASWPPASP